MGTVVHTRVTQGVPLLGIVSALVGVALGVAAPSRSPVLWAPAAVLVAGGVWWWVSARRSEFHLDEQGLLRVRLPWQRAEVRLDELTAVRVLRGIVRVDDRFGARAGVPLEWWEDTPAVRDVLAAAADVDGVAVGGRAALALGVPARDRSGQPVRARLPASLTLVTVVAIIAAIAWFVFRMGGGWGATIETPEPVEPAPSEFVPLGEPAFARLLVAAFWPLWLAGVALGLGSRLVGPGRLRWHLQWAGTILGGLVPAMLLVPWGTATSLVVYQRGILTWAAVLVSAGSVFGLVRLLRSDPTGPRPAVQPFWLVGMAVGGLVFAGFLGAQWVGDVSGERGRIVGVVEDVHRPRHTRGPDPPAEIKVAGEIYHGVGRVRRRVQPGMWVAADVLPGSRTLVDVHVGGR